MKSFKIFPDKARALGNVMNTNSNVGDMVGVNSNIIPLLNEEHPISLDDGGEYVPPATVGYDNFQFPIFQMEVLGSLYETSLTLNVSTSTPYVGDNITITATLRDNNNELLDGNIAFYCGNDCITNGNNTGNNDVYASTTNGVVSFNYSFDSMGEYIITARSVATNMHHSSESFEEVSVSKKPVNIWINSVSDSGNDGSIDDTGYNNVGGSDSYIGSSTEYNDEIKFKVQLVNSNGQPITGLSYSITLDGESFDTGTSTANGEIYTISNLDSGEHTLLVYWPGNNMYASSTETIEVYNGSQLEVYVYYEATDLVNPGSHVYTGILEVDVYYGTNPVSGLPITILIGNDVISDTTNSSGSVVLNGLLMGEGTYSVVVNTSATNQFTATTTTTTVTVP